jgi:ABC-type branched-subunit amino acid transport system substrate-binding protein
MQDFGGIRLYRRGAALTLVRAFLARDERDGMPCSRVAPVIVFAGAGKTALLAELARRLDQNAPCARIDCEDFSGGARELLSLLAFELNRRSGRYRSLPFPRLVTGLIAIQVDVGNPDKDADREVARNRIRQALEDRQNTVKLLEDTVNDIVEAGYEALGSSTPAVAKAAADMIRRIGPRLLLGSLALTRGGRKIILGTGQDWYGHQDRGLKRHSLDVLVDLSRTAAQASSEEDRREVASLLWAAFLADLDDAFGRRNAVNWTFNCLALLDNADAPAGREFLTELVEARRERTGDPLTVVATSRGTLAEQVVPRGERITRLAEASYQGYAARTGERSRWWYPVALPDLAVTDVSAMVSRLELPALTRRSRVTSAVYRYTGGHPIAVSILLDAMAESEETDLAALLEAPDPEIKEGNQPPLADRLLRRLLRRLPAEATEDLVTCSAARDRELALRLGAESGLLRQNWGPEAEIFGAAFWRDRPFAPKPVLHPVVRRLLQRKLAARQAGEPASWRVVHSWLRANALAADDEVGALYHALALGEVEHVARRLAAGVEGTGAQSWLDLLEAVTAAPNALDPTGKSVDMIGELTKWTEPRDLPAAPTARLIAAMWIDADPLSDRHQSALHQEIRADLHQVAPFAREGIGLLREYADKAYGGSVTATSQGAEQQTGQAGAEPPPVSFVPPKSGAGVRRARGLRAVAAAAAVVVAAGAAAGVYTLVGGGGPVSCAPAEGSLQVFVDQGECVGVTDGSFVFDKGETPAPVEQGIAGVEQQILTENNNVVRSGKYVTVGLLAVLTVPPASSTTPSDVTLPRIEDELRGAYLAQYYANHVLRVSPKIKLLLANEGSTEQAWRDDWSQLQQLPATSPGQLVAIAGMGLSVQATVDAAKTIGAARMPMFGAVTTADSLNGQTSPLLAQVVPSVRDEVSALAAYFAKPARSVLVYDQTATDLYTSSLHADLTSAFAASLARGPGAIPYVPSTNGSMLFQKIAQELCYTPTRPTVLYAGRNSVFDQLIGQLEHDGDCNGEQLTVVTAGDADGLAPAATTSVGGGAKVTVIYADIENAADLAPGFKTDFEDWLGKVNDPSMTHSWLLASYNSMLAAASAVGEAEGSVHDPAHVSADDVKLWVNQLNASDSVAGATGTFSVGPDGRLENPSIPIIRLQGGQATTLKVQR